MARSLPGTFTEREFFLFAKLFSNALGFGEVQVGADLCPAGYAMLNRKSDGSRSIDVIPRANEIVIEDREEQARFELARDILNRFRTERVAVSDPVLAAEHQAYLDESAALGTASVEPSVEPPIAAAVETVPADRYGSYTITLTSVPC